jgi:hypothetical protein
VRAQINANLAYCEQKVAEGLRGHKRRLYSLQLAVEATVIFNLLRVNWQRQIHFPCLPILVGKLFARYLAAFFEIHHIQVDREVFTREPCEEGLVWTRRSNNTTPLLAKIASQHHQRLHPLRRRWRFVTTVGKVTYEILNKL